MWALRGRWSSLERPILVPQNSSRPQSARLEAQFSSNYRTEWAGAPGSRWGTPRSPRTCLGRQLDGAGPLMLVARPLQCILGDVVLAHPSTLVAAPYKNHPGATTPPSKSLLSSGFLKGSDFLDPEVGEARRRLRSTTKLQLPAGTTRLKDAHAFLQLGSKFGGWCWMVCLPSFLLSYALNSGQQGFGNAALLKEKEILS